MAEQLEFSDEETGNYCDAQKSYRYNYLAFNIFQVYRHEIVKRVKFNHISHFFLDIFDNIPSSRDSQNMETFLKVLEGQNNLGVLEKLMEALKKRGYTHLFDLINGDKGLTQHHEYCLEIIRENTADLSHELNTKDLAPDLYSKHCINREDYQEILAKCDIEGEIAGALVLLNVIHRYHENWYEIFLETLEKKDLHILIKSYGLNRLRRPRTDNQNENSAMNDQLTFRDRKLQKPKEMYNGVRSNIAEAEAEAGGLSTAQEYLSKDDTNGAASIYERLNPSSMCDRDVVYQTVSQNYDDCWSGPPPKPCSFKKNSYTEENDVLARNGVEMRAKEERESNVDSSPVVRNASVASRLFDVSERDQFRGSSEILALTVTDQKGHTCRWKVNKNTLGRPTYDENESPSILLQLKGINGFQPRGKCQCSFLSLPCKDGSYYIWIHEEYRVVMLSVRYAQEWRFFKIHKTKDGSGYYLDKRQFISRHIGEVIAYYEKYPISDKLSNDKAITVWMLYPWGTGLRTSSMIT